MKRIYFVRHGQTLYNKGHVHQPPTVSLSETGKRQARTAGRYLRTKHPSLLLSSTFTRARETSGIIAEEIELPVEENDLFVELRRPPVLFGRSYFSPVSLFHFGLWYLFKRSRADGATFENEVQISARIQAARAHLEASESQEIVVVSHALFITLFVRHVCAQKPITFFEFMTIIFRATQTKNGSVTTLIFDPDAPSGACPWHCEERCVPTEKT